MMRAYAHRHGYGFEIIDPSQDAPGCVQLFPVAFFFAKHCAVREWLARQPPNYVAVVIDTDMSVGAADSSLSRWMEDGADVVFYTRMWNYEIAAGNYIVRNTEFSRTFLQAWTMFYNHMPTGFSSQDNGALHLALLQAVGIPNRDCYQQYQALAGDSSFVGLTTYYLFIACVRRVMGVGRYWDVSLSGHQVKADRSASVDGRITIQNRFHGFAFDGILIGHRVGGRIPFHHGIKNMSLAAQVYAPEFQLKTLNDHRLERSIPATATATATEWVDASNTAVVLRCAFDPMVRCDMRYGAQLAQKPFRNAMDQARMLSGFEHDRYSVGKAGYPWQVVPHYDLTGCLVETVAFGCRTKRGMPGGELDTKILLGDEHSNTSLVAWWGTESSPSYENQLAKNKIISVYTLGTGSRK